MVFIPIYFQYQIWKDIMNTSFHDSLTGLHNRAAFNKHFEKLIRKKHSFQVLMIDLCKFKEINDRHGHHVGDEVLTIIGSRLRESIRSKDFVARLGGDEFVILLYGSENKDVISNIIKNVKNEITFDEKCLNVGLSIGSASYPNDGDNISILMKRADYLMYKAKESGVDILYFQKEA